MTRHIRAAAKGEVVLEVLDAEACGWIHVNSVSPVGSDTSSVRLVVGERDGGWVTL